MLVSTLSIAFSFLIIGIFLVSGLSKLRKQNHWYYKNTIENYDMVPSAWAGPMVKFIACVEIFIALLTLVPSIQKVGLVLAACMLLIYGYSFIKQLEQGRVGIACGCSGPASDLTISAALVIRNAVLVLLCLVACLTPWGASQTNWSIVVPAAMALGLIYISIEQLLSNNQKIQALRLSKL